MDAPELRPLAIGEILDVAIKIYRAGFGTLARATAIVAVPTQILVVLVQLSITPESPGVPGPTSTPGANVSVAAGFVVIVAAFISAQLATAAAVRAVSDQYLGGRSSWRESITYALQRLPSLLWLTVVAFVPIALVAIFVIPAVYLMVSWTAAVPVVLLENIKGRRALGRSWRLTRHRWWPTLAALLLAVVLYYIVRAAVALPLVAVFAAGTRARSAPSVGAQLVAGSVASILSTPFLAAVVTVLYYDHRVRKEGFDLQLAAQRLGPDLDPPLPQAP